MLKQNRNGSARNLALRPSRGSLRFWESRSSSRNAWLPRGSSPVVQRHKLTLFDHDEVALCWARILRGEKPLR